MKFLTIAALSLFAFGVFAEDRLMDMKSSANEHITEKINMLNSSKTCIDGAKTKESFKACKYDMDHSMKMQRQEMMKNKKELMDE